MGGGAGVSVEVGEEGDYIITIATLSPLTRTTPALRLNAGAAMTAILMFHQLLVCL